MKKLRMPMKPFLFIAAIALFLSACSKDQENPMNSAELTQVELRTILETDDVAGSADTILAEIYVNGASLTGKTAVECYETTYTETGYIVTFNNCVLNGTDNANGTITVVYSTEPGTASFTATFVDFYIGDVKLNGTRTYTINGDANQAAVSFTVSSTMTAEFGNGTLITEIGTKEFGLVIGDSLETSTYSISGTWELQVNDDQYAVNITSPLGGNFSCGYITSGEMVVNKNGLEVTVDFGDGTCDTIVTISYPNGATEEVTLED
jgi:hypothetical protein